MLLLFAISVLWFISCCSSHYYFDSNFRGMAERKGCSSDSLLRHYCGAPEWNCEVSKPIACSFSTWYSTLDHYPKNGGTVLHFRDFNVLISTPAGKRLARKGGWEGRRNSYRIISENLKRKIVFGILRAYITLILWNNFKEIACQVWTEKRYFKMRDAKGISEYVNEPSISAKGQLWPTNCWPFCQEPPVYNNRKN